MIRPRAGTRLVRVQGEAPEPRLRRSRLACLDAGSGTSAGAYLRLMRTTPAMAMARPMALETGILSLKTRRPRRTVGAG